MRTKTEMKASIAVGSLLVIIACAGFATVADDFRHSGEFFAVSGILVSGFAFLASGLFPKLQSFLALQWIGAGIAVGLLFGAFLDRVALGLGAGLGLGLLLAYFHRNRGSAGPDQGT
jgi:hypothetical protein